MSFRKRNEVVSSRTLPSGPSIARGSGAQGNAKWVRPSTLLPSYPTVSTGTGSLDKVLLHGGQPLGTSILIIENSATDFASVVARCYTAQGVSNQDVIVAVGAGPRWGLELPSPVEPRPDERAPEMTARRTPADLKIAWRYRQAGPGTDSAEAANQSSVYCRTWDVTARQLPPPTIQHIEASSYADILARLESIVANTSARQNVRAVVPGFLTPTVYDPAVCFEPSELLRFLMSLRALLRVHSTRLTVLLTLSRGLFDEDGRGNSILLPWIESVVDGVINIVPMSVQPSPESGSGRYQGFIDISKLPIVSERGGMAVRKLDYAFKVGKSGLMIENWGIPVMIDEKEDDKAKDALEY